MIKEKARPNPPGFFMCMPKTAYMCAVRTSVVILADLYRKAYYFTWTPGQVRGYSLDNREWNGSRRRKENTWWKIQWI